MTSNDLRFPMLKFLFQIDKRSSLFKVNSPPIKDTSVAAAKKNNTSAFCLGLVQNYIQDYLEKICKYYYFY